MRYMRYLRALVLIFCAYATVVDGILDEKSSREDCYAAGQLRGQKGLLAVHFPVFYYDLDGKQQNKSFCVFYSELLTWRQLAFDFVHQFRTLGDDVYATSLEKVNTHTEAKLIRMGFPKEIVDGNNNSKLPEEMMHNPWTAEYASVTILETAYAAPFCREGKRDWDAMFSHIETSNNTQRELEQTEAAAEDQDENGDYSVNSLLHMYPPVLASAEPAGQIFINNKKISTLWRKRTNVVSMVGDLMERRRRMNELEIAEKSKYNTSAMTEGLGGAGTHGDVNSSKTREKSLFIVYQTPDVNTGGTTALRVLYEHLVLTGTNALLCHEVNKYQTQNYNSSVCWDPPPHAIVITGEWCHEVMEYYGIQRHPGRGIQYHLGFHQAGDACNGHIALAGSHYLSNNLLSRVLSGYYLGAPMATDMQQRFESILNSAQKPPQGGVAKENLVLIDTDFADDYPPIGEQIHFNVPERARYVMMKDFDYEEVLFLLQRAKVTLDLAMPGAERLSGEGVLLGAVPIVASRWNGGSDIDFPGVLRVEALNGTAITEMIAYALDNYDEILHEERHAQFYAYIMSLGERLENTIDVLATSSTLKFVMKANDLQEETMACLLATTILYLFPLASVDIYVADVRWFNIHHYTFLTVMHGGGAMRDTNRENRINNSNGISLVKIFAHQDFDVKSAGALPESEQATLFSSEFGAETAVILLSCNTETSRMFSNAQVFAQAAEEQLAPASSVAKKARVLHLYSHHEHEKSHSSTQFPQAEEETAKNSAVNNKIRHLSQFAVVFPVLTGAEDDSLITRFLKTASDFFADEGNAHESQAHVEEIAQKYKGNKSDDHVLVVQDASLRNIEELKLCQSKTVFLHANAGMNTSCESMPSIDVLDGIRESAAWGLLNTYYCNIL